MTHFIMGIVAFCVSAFCMASVFGKRRTMAPTSLPDVLSAPQAAMVARPEQPEAEWVRKSVPVTLWATTPICPPRYILGAEPADKTAAMMDMMAGPGLCTPRNH